MEYDLLKCGPGCEIEIDFDHDLSMLACGLAMDPQLLLRKIDAVNTFGAVAERRNVGTICVIIESRMIKSSHGTESLAGINIGHQGAGKSFVMSTIRKLYPRDHFYVLSSATAKSIFNLGGELIRKVLFLDEALALKSEGNLPNVIRLLISEGRASHQRSVRMNGEITTETIVVEGPIAFLSTTNTPKLEEQLADRLIRIHPDTSEEQTKRIMTVQAQAAAGVQSGLDAQELAVWQAFHDSLEPYEVLIPFALEIGAFLAQGVYSLSARRAFQRVLSAIKAVTILYQQQREVDDQGRLIADMADYAMVYQLFSELFLEESSELQQDPTGRRLKMILAAGRLSVTDLAKQDGVTKQAISEWTNKMLETGILYWCDTVGRPFNSQADLRKAKPRGTAFLASVSTYGLPSPFELTKNPAWDEHGDLSKCYDLDLDGVSGSRLTWQNGEGVTENIHVSLGPNLSEISEGLGKVIPIASSKKYNGGTDLTA